MAYISHHITLASDPKSCGSPVDWELAMSISVSFIKEFHQIHMTELQALEIATEWDKKNEVLK